MIFKFNANNDLTLETSFLCNQIFDAYFANKILLCF